MSCVSIMGSNLFKKSIPLYAKTPLNSSTFNTFSVKTMKASENGSMKLGFISTQVKGQTHNPVDRPEVSPPTPPDYRPGLPPEIPQTPNVPDFDPIPPEKPADPPPLSPGPNPGPEFPGPPNPDTEFPRPPYPSPPEPEAPVPPTPSPPGLPEVIPPYGPEIIPHKPIEPDIPPPIMGSDGLVFY